MVSRIENKRVEDQAKSFGLDIKLAWKIDKFLRRNQIRNAHLYNLPIEQENESFVICPILGIRTLNIKSKYIEGVLGITVENFKTRFPDQPLSCKGHAKTIIDKLHIADESGKTPYQKSQEKSRAKLLEVGEDGFTGDERRGKKVRSTHMNNVDENGLNGYQQLAQTARPNQIKTLISQGKVTPLNQRIEWFKYRNFCIWLTVPKKSTVLGNFPTGKMGTQGAYQVDHIFPIFEGFKQKISPFVISDIHNLRLLTWQDNAIKHTNCDITKENLFNLTSYEPLASDDEFAFVYSLILNNPKIQSSEILIQFNQAFPEKQRKYR